MASKPNTDTGLVVRTVQRTNPVPSVTGSSAVNNADVIVGVPSPTVGTSTVKMGGTGSGGGTLWGYPWYIVFLGVTSILALAVGLGVGLGSKSSTTSTSPPPKIRLNMELTFSVTGKEVNVTFVSELRCLIATLTDPAMINQTLLTGWVENNGPTIQVGPDHPLNQPTDCAAGSQRRRRMRRLQTVNSSYVMPIDPLSVAVSAVSPEVTDAQDVSFVDAIYSSDEIKAVAPLLGIEQEGGIEILPTTTPTSSSSPSSTPSTNPDARTCKYLLVWLWLLDSVCVAILYTLR